MLQHALFKIFPNSPLWPPSSLTSNGFLLWCASDSDDGADLQGHQRKCTGLPTSKHWFRPHAPARALRSSMSAVQLVPPIAESKQSPLTQVTTIFCFGTSVVEWTPDQCQDSGITLHLPKMTQNSFVQTPWPRVASLPPPPKKNICTCMFVSLALMHLKILWQRVVTILRWGLDNCFYISFTPSTAWMDVVGSLLWQMYLL